MTALSPGTSGTPLPAASTLPHAGPPAPPHRTAAPISLHRVLVPTPFGPVVLLAGERGLRGLVLPPPPLLSPRPRGEPHAPAHGEEGDEDTGGWLAAAARQVRDYLLGLGCRLEVPLDLRGSPFQLRVWSAARRIPWGATVTYGELASRLGDARLARAVGRALSRNPVPLFVPCHRVVAADGLGGFAAGSWWKRRLLALEGHAVPTRHA